MIREWTYEPPASLRTVGRAVEGTCLENKRTKVPGVQIPHCPPLSCVKTSFRCFGTFCFVFCVGMCQDIVPFLSVMVVAGRSF